MATYALLRFEPPTCLFQDLGPEDLFSCSIHSFLERCRPGPEDLLVATSTLLFKFIAVRVSWFHFDSLPRGWLDGRVLPAVDCFLADNVIDLRQNLLESAFD